MTNEKAREYFSAYSEGTLDAGLSHSFEAKLKADASLRAEYDQFASMLQELESLKHEEIEVPFDLNERIGAALDRNLFERKRAAKPAWSLWVRNLGFAGLAAAALYGAYLSINAVTGTGPSIASPVPVEKVVPQTVEQIQFTKTDEGVQMFYKPSEAHKVEVKGGVEGDASYVVTNGGWYGDLKNPQANSVAFVVTVEGDTQPTVVVVPGTERKTIETANGSLVELAKAVADQYGVPIVVRSVHKDSELAWKVDSDAEKTLQSTLANPSFSVSKVGDVIHIESN